MAKITEIFIDAKNGCDWFNGSTPYCDRANGALKTIGSAIKKITSLRDTKETFPITVWLMPGEYYIDETVVIPKGCDNITFRAYSGGVTIIGAKKLENLEIDELYGTKCLSAKLPQRAIAEDLFANGERAEITRYPENGYLTPVETGSGKAAELHCGTDWIIADRNLEEFDGIYDATISFRHFWVDEWLKIESIDTKTNKVVFTNATCFTVYTDNDTKDHESSGRNGDANLHKISDANSRMDYVIEGLPQMLKKPNSWVYKKDENKIYYIPKNFEAENELYVPAVKKLFDIYSNEIVFCGISFKYTSSQYDEKVEKTHSPYAEKGKNVAGPRQAFWRADGAINFYGAHNCRIEKCTISDFGLYAVNIDNECSDIEVEKCQILNGGGGGVKVWRKCNMAECCDAGEDVLVADNISVCDCLIKNIGLIHTAACGILLMDVKNSRFLHNEICYTGYSGISIGWEWGYKHQRTHDNRIEKNHIHHISQGQLSDLGGIYLLGIQRGTRVRANLIHDVRDKTYGASGIYADEGASQITFEENICYNVDDNGFQLHFGFENVVRNNIFESGRLGALWVWMHDLNPGLILKHNILIAKDNDYIFGGAKVDVPPCTMESDYNLYWDYSKTPIMGNLFKTEKSFEDWQTENELDRNSIVADPEFCDYENKDFTLKKNSPAYKIGFRDIDMSDVGIRK